jgi:hypothetical protein
MIWSYLAIFLVGVALTARLAAWRSRQSITAGIGTALAGLAILSGFSIGWAIAPVSVVVLALAAAPHLSPVRPPLNER